MKLRPVWCHTCDEWVWPWQRTAPWGGRRIHVECYEVQVGVGAALDVLDGPR